MIKNRIKIIKEIIRSNFILILYVGLMFCILSLPGQAGKYTEEFEYDVTNYGFPGWAWACKVVPKAPHHIEIPVDISVEVGHSEGHYGTIKHYKKEKGTQTHTVATGFECSFCKLDYGSSRPVFTSFSPPKITIQQKGNVKVMTVDETGRKSHVCGKPRNSGRIWNIWEKAGCPAGKWSWVLERMWETAKQLDGINSSEESLHLPLISLHPVDPPLHFDLVPSNSEPQLESSKLLEGGKLNLLSNSEPKSDITYKITEKSSYCCCSIQ